MTKQATEQTNPVDAAKTLEQLEQKRQQHRERGVELEAARKRASYGAHALHAWFVCALLAIASISFGDVGVGVGGHDFQSR